MKSTWLAYFIIEMTNESIKPTKTSTKNTNSLISNKTIKSNELIEQNQVQILTVQ